jgi:cytochrome c556
MQAWMLAAVVAAGMGPAGVALAQGDVVTERRAGLDRVQRQFEAIAAIVEQRGDQRQAVGQVDAMIAFFRAMPERFPAATLTPPLTLGRDAGQTRARDAIEANRADFAQRNADMVTSLVALRAAAESGSISGDMLRNTGNTCLACHRGYRAR